MNTILLQTSKYLREWAIHTFGNPVRFPLRSREHALLRYYLGLRPKGMEPETERSFMRLTEGGKKPLRIAVPVIRWKPFSRFNYLPEKGRRALRGSLKALFDITLWNEMEPHLYSLPRVIRREIDIWCERHGISPDNAETVLQHFREMQRTYAQHNVPVRRKYRCA